MCVARLLHLAGLGFGMPSVLKNAQSPGPQSRGHASRGAKVSRRAASRSLASCPSGSQWESRRPRHTAKRAQRAFQHKARAFYPLGSRRSCRRLQKPPNKLRRHSNSARDATSHLWLGGQLFVRAQHTSWNRLAARQSIDTPSDGFGVRRTSKHWLPDRRPGCLGGPSEAGL